MMVSARGSYFYILNDNRMYIKKAMLSAALSVFMFTVYCQQHYTLIHPGDTEAGIIRKAAGITPSPRQLRWQQLELTAFFHFGINTFTNKEWGDGKEDPALFDPTALDAEQWIRAVRDAGIRQVILTAKHHDGFCLWPSLYTDHSVKSSPWKNGKGDVVKEVADACRKYGIGFGIYLSPWDRNSPLYGDSLAYNTYFMNQLTELLSHYGRIDEVWFDGANGEGPNGKKQVYDFNAWYALIRKLQPAATIAIMGPDVRWVGTESGYGRETEWSVVPADNISQEAVAAGSQKDISFKPQGDMTGDDLGSRSKILKAKGLVWYPAETDVSIRPGWFYHPAEDGKVKTPEKLLDIYFSSVGRNSVLLLNIPPDKRGLIHENDVQHLKAWKQKIDSIFSDNLIRQAKIRAVNGKNAAAIADENYDTYFTTAGSDTTATINITLPDRRRFNVLSLQENITVGQRVEKFRVEYKDNNEWKTAVEGTTIGYKRLMRFDPVVAKEVRLVILSSRSNPAIAAFGLYNASF
jgi:alpha-L-fucosidase